MGLRFYRRLSLIPGLRVNLSKSGASLSIGHRGAWYTIGPRGSRATIGLPGTGLYYTATSSPRRRLVSVEPVPPADQASNCVHDFLAGYIGAGNHGGELFSLTRCGSNLLRQVSRPGVRAGPMFFGCLAFNTVPNDS